MEPITIEGETRRTFCRLSTLGCLGVAFGASLEGCSSNSPTSPSNVSSLPVVGGAISGSSVTVTVDPSSPLATVGNAALVQAPGANVLVARTGDATFVALTATCTHQACTINGYANQTYVCPCHGSTFTFSGQVVGGPAPSPLQQYHTQFTNGVLTISA
jgi:Rieske Fe-S protein